MDRSTALGSALLAGSAIGLFGWDMSKPESFAKVNEQGSTKFRSTVHATQREERWRFWKRAVERARGWDEDKEE
jgi:glycerol kinase